MQCRSLEEFDVREAAASLPDVVEESEVMDDLPPEIDESEFDEPSEIKRDE